MSRDVLYVEKPKKSPDAQNNFLFCCEVLWTECSELDFLLSKPWTQVSEKWWINVWMYGLIKRRASQLSSTSPISFMFKRIFTACSEPLFPSHLSLRVDLRSIWGDASKLDEWDIRHLVLVAATSTCPVIIKSPTGQQKHTHKDKVYMSKGKALTTH